MSTEGQIGLTGLAPKSAVNLQYPDKIRCVLQPPIQRPLSPPSPAASTEFVLMDQVALKEFFQTAKAYLTRTTGHRVNYHKVFDQVDQTGLAFAQQEIPEYTADVLALECDFLADMVNFTVFYNGEARGLVADGHLVSVNSTRYSMRRAKDAWGAYITFHFAYTLPRYRFLGYATALNHHVEENAREQGYARVRSLVLSRSGFRLHRRFGHHIWGIAEKGELVVDSPLSNKAFPATVPKRARSVTARPTPLTDDELLQLLVDARGPFAYTEEEAKNILSKPVVPPMSHWPAASFTPQADQMRAVQQIPEEFAL